MLLFKLKVIFDVVFYEQKKIMALQHNNVIKNMNFNSQKNCLIKSEIFQQTQLLKTKAQHLK